MSKHVQAEFHRPLEIEHIPPSGCTEYLVANAAECAALATRLRLPRLHGLRARLRAERLRAGGAMVTGELTADIEQNCVVSLEDFRSTVTFPIERIFLPAKEIPDDDSAEADADPVVEGKIDLGELVTETLSLNLDAYPRKPGARFDSPDDAEETPSSPFAELRKLTSAGG
jgi:uncharacterized metal-binding protein YceD (DUF177 family)